MNVRTQEMQLAVLSEPRPMPAFLAVPETPGPRGAVVVLEEIFGVNRHIRDVTERVAREGYVAIAPDIHHRAAPGQELAYDAEGVKRGMALIPQLTAAGFDADLRATLDALRARPDVKIDRVGCMGFCIGGHLAYLAACTSDLRATASFYGGGIATFSPGGGAPTLEKTGGIRGRILCLFGREDQAIPQAQVQAIRAALELHRVRHEVVVYDGAGHGFFCDQRAAFHPPSRDDAWERVKRLFREELS
jgi:carboxymethylenebutenolidase